MIQEQEAVVVVMPENIKLSEIKNVAIPLCLGGPKDLKDGCHARLNKSIEGLESKKTLIIQTGGTSKKPLCIEMRDVLREAQNPWSERFLSVPLGWGTRSEIYYAFYIINEFNKKEFRNGMDTSSGFKVVIASNKAHLPRIEWFVWLYNIHNVKVEYREAKHRFGLINTLREYIGTPLIVAKDMFMILVRFCYR